MEVAVLTARLEAEVAGFLSALKTADRQLTETQSKLRDLERTAYTAKRTMKEIGLDPGQSITTQAQARMITSSLNEIYKQAIQTDDAVDDIGISDSTVAKFIADSAIIKQELRSIQREANQTQLARSRGADIIPGGGVRRSNFMGFGGSGGFLPGRTFAGGPAGTFPGESGVYSPSPADRARMNAAYMAAQSSTPEALAARQMAQDQRVYQNEVRNLAQARRVAQDLERLRGSTDAIPLGTSNGPDKWMPKLLAEQTQRDRVLMQAKKYLRDSGVAENDIASLAHDVERIGGRTGFSGGGGRGGNILSDLINGGGRYGGGRNGRYNVPGPNILAGILPGGSRARPAALALLAGGIGALGPAAVPAAAGIGVGAAAAIPALLGAMGTLKLAFADMSAASFTTAAGFKALTPAQQSLVISLKSLDAGVLTPLEKVAQEGLIPKLTTALHTAVSPQLVGALRTSVGAFSSGIGNGANDIAKVIGSPGFAKNFQAVMVADSRYVRQFLGDIGRLTGAFFVLLRSAIPLTNWFSKLGVEFSKWVNTTTRASAASGGLTKFFDNAKTSLQVIGKLVENLAKLLGAFGSAIGLDNSLGLIKLLSAVINGLTHTLRANKNLLHDFFAGALGAARQILAIVQPLANFLSRILGVLNKLINATVGWTHAIEILLGVLTVKWLQGVLLKLGAIGIAEGVMAGGAAKAAASVGGLRAALLLLGGADVLAALAAVAAPLAVIAATAVPIISFTQNANVNTYDTKRGTVFRAQDGHWYLRPTGSRAKPQQITAVQAQALVGPGHNVVAEAAAAETAAQSSAANGSVAGAGGFAALSGVASLIRGVKAGQFAQSLNLPASIKQQVRAASAGHGSMTAANAKAYAYYNQLLRTPGLTQAQKGLIYDAQSLFFAPGAFQQSGGGGTGFSGSTSAGGSVFNAQQNVSLAMQAGSGASFSQQIAAAKAYQKAASDAYNKLKAQTVVAKDAAAKQTQLTALLKDETQARKDILTITHRQAVAEEKAAKAAAKAHAKALDDARKTQITQHQTRISAISSAFHFAIGTGSTPQQQLSASHRAIVQAGSQWAQLVALNKRLLDQDKQTYQIKSEEGRIQKEILAAQKVVAAATKEQAKALKAQALVELNKKWEKIFGIASGTSVSVQGVRAQERNALLHIVRSLPHALAQHIKGMSSTTNPLGAIPGAANMPIDKLIKALKEHGVHFTKAALKDFERIKAYLAAVEKLHGKVDPVIRDQIVALLKQIEQNTNPLNHALPTYHLASLKTVMANLTAIKDPAKRKAAAEKLLEMEIYGGMLPKVHAVAGVPIYPHHAVSMPGTGPHARQIQEMSVVIHINGHNKDPKVLAAEVRNELLKTRRHNSPQTRGFNGGRSVGLA